MATDRTLKEVPLGSIEAFTQASGEQLEIYLPGGGNSGPVLYRGNGTNASSIDCRRLAQSGVATMLIAADELAHCEETLERELSSLMTDPNIAPEKKAVCAQQVGVCVARDLIAGHNPAGVVDRASSLFDSLLLAMLENPAVASSLLSMSAHHRTTASHLFAVSVLGMMLGQEVFGNDEKQLHALAMAGILHDIGKSSIDADILSKAETLSPEEIALIRQHPVESIRLIGDETILDFDVYRAILEHHERYDGGGYPLGLVGQQISLHGRILAIVDSFHAMIGRRDYRDSLSPNEALRVMRCQVGKQFDPELFEHWEAVMNKGFVPQANTANFLDETGGVSSGYHSDHKTIKQKQQISRKAERRPVDGQRRLKCVPTGLLPGGDRPISMSEYALIDLSRAGACLEVASPMYRGEVVSVCIQAGDQSQWIRSVVRWCRQMDAEGGRYFMGIQFLHRLSPEEVMSRYPVFGMLT